MPNVLTPLALAFVLAWGTLPPLAAAQRQSSPGLQRRIAGWLRPSLQRQEQTLRELTAKLKTLPPLAAGSRGESVGYHSQFRDSAGETLDIVIDLGRSYPIDRVAVFSASAMFQGETIARYGFPRRFQIEVAQDRDFEQSKLLVDSAQLSPNMQSPFPVQVMAQVSARFLRLRVLEQWTRGDGRHLTALGEVMILSGGRNVAIGAKVEAMSFSSLPDWSLENLVDGQTDLGLPIGPEPSATNGFLSKGQRVPETQKWVQLELPREASVDEVRLIPTTPFDAPSQHGHGFPRRFRVVASASPDFSSAQVIADQTKIAFPNPGDNPVVLPADGVKARFIRLEAEELWHISQRYYSLALAEVQVFEDGENIAPGATVTASDVFDVAPYDLVWSPEFLVDGYSSQNQLIDLESWLTGLGNRAMVEHEIDLLRKRVAETVEGTTNALLVLAAALTATLATLTGVTLVRRKRALAKQRDEMRARIARDLHDDLGSRLGGMRLISETMLDSSELPPSLKEDVALIHRASREATDAMRDIVWLLDNSESSRSKLITHFREITPSLLGGLACEFTTEETMDQPLDFDFRRHILFAFKECVGNAAKHAHAKQVDCHIGGGVKRFTFEVRDDGDGFSVEDAELGYGLKNLRSRAESLGGDVSIVSRPGEGTRVTFDVPIQLRKNG